MPVTEEKQYYVLDIANCRYIGMTKEQIMTAITQAVNQGTIGDIDTGFVSKVLEKNGEQYAEFWIGTAAEYAALTTKEDYVFYKITDDTSADDIQQQFTEVYTEIEGLSDDITEASTSISTLETEKADVVHNHSATDITSGTLPVSRGGTGVTSISTLASNIRGYIISTISGSGTITRTLANFTEYRFTNVTSLTLSYPSGNFECWIRMTVRTGGTATVSFPSGTTYIGNIPESFEAGKTYEISIKDKIVIISEVI